MPKKKKVLSKKVMKPAPLKKKRLSLPMAETAVSLQKVTKKYQLHHEKPTFVDRFFGKTSREEFLALHDVNIEIPQGQKLAIVGKNGSGKTTLLKVICGVTQPTQGKVETRGRVVSLIDLEAGFHPELNGYENIALNGLVVGMSRAEIKERTAEIIDFAQIGSFIDAPLFTYSEGMKLRLGFSIAVHADPDILVLDEMIATGDANFQKKCFDRIEHFFQLNKTIITVSHIMGFIEPYYQRFIWMEHGKVKADGDKRVIEEYRKTW